ncbi:tail morphogenetic protein [Staphylococcus phage vB_SsapH-Golestan101-M]|nr:tail morphogenetic protein [Staphylococcus phage vB_SsapH-Golestan101-M]
MSNFLKNLHPLLKRKKNTKDNKDPHYAIINMFSEELDNLEQETIDSKIQSSLGTATGKYLDIYGDWYGLIRKKNELDDNYRDRIIEYVLLKRGTNNSIIGAIKRFLEDEDVYVDIYEPFKNIFYTNKSHLNGEDHLMGDYYRFAIIDITIGKSFPLEIMEEINKFKPAGVKIYFTYDGSYDLGEDKIITPVFYKSYPKVTTYQDVDIFRGYGRILYGHLNLGIAKVKDITDVFKTNNSLINSLDVLSGSATVGREFYNYAYRTQNRYVPRMGDYVTTISSESSQTKGEELNKDFYTETSIRNSIKPELVIEGNNKTTNIHFNLDTIEYLRRKGIVVSNLDMSEKELINYVSNYFGEVSLDLDIQAMVSPSNPLSVNLSIYDFGSYSWVTVSRETLTLTEKNIGNKIGNLIDYLNDNLSLFIKLEVEPVKEDTELRIGYFDLTFRRYEKDVYTIKPFKGLIESHQETNYLVELDAIKDMDIDNGDIITKSGYQPMQYLRLTDGYDNNINRNLLLDSETREADRGGSNSRRVIYNISEGLIPGEYYTITYELNTKNLDRTTILITEDIGDRITVELDETTRNKYTFIANENISEISIFTGLAYTEENYIGKITRAKLEKGQTATPYQPNPEDIYGASNPNKYIDVLPRDKDNNVINNRDIPIGKNVTGMNLLPNSRNISKSYSDTIGSYAQYWYTYITDTHKYFEKGDSITISFDIQMERGDIIRVYDSNRHWDYRFGEAIFNNIGNKKQRLSFTRELKEPTKSSPEWQLAFFANDNGDRFEISKIKVEKGTEATPYSGYYEDDTQFLDKLIKFNGVYNNVQTISIYNTIPITKSILETSIYGDKYKRLKTLTDIKSGETHTDNELVDLYGIKNLTYQSLNPFSQVIIRPFLDFTITKLMEDIGNIVDLPNGFFNALWQEVDIYTEHKNPTPIVLKDVANGIIDNSTGEVVKVPKQSINTYTDSDIETLLPAEYKQQLTLDSNLTLGELADTKLSTKEINITHIPQVTTESSQNQH